MGWDMRRPLVRLDIVWRCSALTYGKARSCVASMQLRVRRGVRVGKAHVLSWCMACLIALAWCMAVVDSLCRDMPHGAVARGRYVCSMSCEDRSVHGASYQ